MSQPRSQNAPDSGAGQPAAAAGHSSTHLYQTRGRPVRADDATEIRGRVTPPPSAAAVPIGGTHWATALLGQTLDNFRLDELVGSGGMGSVFRAEDVNLSRTVAVKILAPESAVDEELVRRFKNEGQSAARLNHEHAARVLQVGEARGMHYIVYEFIEGANLREIVEKHGPLSLKHAIHYTLQIAQTLEHAHAQEIVHRDIKPSNILITPEGVAKLVDMGLARSKKSAGVTDLTESGMTLGTFDYISPEQARDPRDADVRSDIYSLGCTLFYMLAGRPPFPEGTALKKMMQHAQDDPPDPREYRDDVSNDVVRIRHRMLAKSPHERFQKPGELIAELMLLIDPQGVRSNKLHATWTAAAPAVNSNWTKLEHYVPFVVPVVLLLGLVTWVQLTAREEVPVLLQPQHVVAPGRGMIDAGGEKFGPDGDPSSRDPSDRPSRERGSPEPRVPDSQSPSDKSPGDKLPGNVEPIDKPPPSVPDDPAPPGDRDAVSPPRKVPVDVPAVKPEVPAAPAIVVRQYQDPHLTDPPVSLERVLNDAVAAAQVQGASEVRIDLNFTGEREFQPVVVPRFPITITAAAGKRPGLVFRPRSIDPQEYARSMFQVGGGQLTLRGIDLDVQLPREPTDGWSLVELVEAEKLRLEECTLSIRNSHQPPMPTHQSVSFFAVRGKRTGPSMMADDEKRPPLLSVRLENCVVRGEAMLLHVASSTVQPVRLVWDNGLFASSDRLLVAEGLVREPTDGSDLRLTLRHVTASLAGLCLLSDQPTAKFSVSTTVDCEYCIFKAADVLAEQPPLVEQRGVNSLEDYRERFLFRGEGNFYEGFAAHWRVQPLGAEGEPTDLDFSDWKAHWGDRERLAKPSGFVQWRRLPTAQTAVHAYVPSDFALAAQDSNPAKSAAPHNRDAGATPRDLPSPPTPPTPDTGPESNKVQPP